MRKFIKLSDARKGLYYKCIDLFRDDVVANSVYACLCDGIDECDTVELQEKKGKWVKSEIPNETYVCSVCGGACWYYDFMSVVKKSKFCPNCGADMRGDIND